jgi:hypothetical protein
VVGALAEIDLGFKIPAGNSRRSTIADRVWTDKPRLPRRAVADGEIAL